MTTPREPDGRYGRHPYDRGPYDRDPDDRGPTGWDPEGGTADWGRPPAGGWGAADEADRPGSWGGPYGDEPEYGWQPVEQGAAGRYGPGPGGHEPSWSPGRAATTTRRAGRRRRRQPWIPVVAAAVVVVAFLVLGFVVPGWFVTRVFDATAVQSGVAKILTEDYGVEGVADVRCPERVQVTVGATFTCEATIDGDPVKVPVRVTGGDGGYEVGRPT
jgi:Domain of unknown function (DUF4333)